MRENNSLWRSPYPLPYAQYLLFASESNFPIIFVIEFIHRSFTDQLASSKTHKKCLSGLGIKSFHLKALLNTVTDSVFYCVAVSPFAGAFEYFIACCLPSLFLKA